ncbi:MAG: acyl-CoA thioesterase [Anaerolineales bacterium]
MPPFTFLSDPIFRYTFTIPPEALDGNGHVNNVHYVQWMQDVAVRHFGALGGVPLVQALGATWVVRSHNVEYLSPAFAGEQIEVRTWVANVRRVRSLRRYEFARISDGRLLVRGATEWVFVDAKSGRPLSIPAEVVQGLPLLPDKLET